MRRLRASPCLIALIVAFDVMRWCAMQELRSAVLQILGFLYKFLQCELGIRGWRGTIWDKKKALEH